MPPSTPSTLALPTTGWNSTPPEIVLEIVSHLDYDPKALRDLLLVDRRMHRIMQDYEHSLCKAFATGQLRVSVLRSPDMTPQVKLSSSHWFVGVSYSMLAAVHSRSNAVSELAQAIKSNSPCWLCKWRHIFECGILLLHRLQARGAYEAKVDFIFSMPVHGLVAVFLVLHYGCKAAQNAGAGIINGWNQPRDERDRMELFLMFEDLFLRGGPEFLSDILNHDMDAAEKLRSEWQALESLQIPDDNGNPPRRSLISYFNQAISLALECRLNEVLCISLDVATTKAMRNMTEASVTKLVRFDCPAC